MKKRILKMFGLFAFLFTIGIINVEAQIPEITISGNNHVVTTGTLVDSYNLTIDYSQVTNLTDLVIRYRVNDGEWQNVNFRTDQTSHRVTIRSGANGFGTNRGFHNIEVYAENSSGRSETLTKRLLVIFFATRDFTHEATGITGRSMRFPVNTQVEVERVTDPEILNQIPLLNMTVYRITPRAEGEKAGLLISERGLSPLTHYITFRIPIPENLRGQLRFGQQIGWVFPPGFNESDRSNYQNNPTTHFTMSTSRFILEHGYAYYVLASGIDPNHQNSSNITQEDENNTTTIPPTTTQPPIENPPTHFNTQFLLLSLLLGGAILGGYLLKKKNSWKVFR